MELDVPKEEPKQLKQWLAEYRQKTKLGTVELAAVFCLQLDEFMELYS